MFSPTKKADQELLQQVIRTVELLVKMKSPAALDTAQRFGTTYEQLDNRIKTHDYTKEDESYFRVEKMLNTRLT